MNKDQLILASQSPRRIEILQAHGHDPLVLPVDVDETLPEGIAVEDAVMYLSLKKALACEAAHPEHAGKIILAADTMVYKDEIMGKPANVEEARHMITAIRGTVHQVLTGVTILVAGEAKRRSFVDITDVHCRSYTGQELELYIRTPEPYDKAGGYAIQGTFGRYIDHIEGDYENVVGLPYPRLRKELDRMMTL